MDRRQNHRLAKFNARRDQLVRTAQCRQRLFVPTPADAWHAFATCFATVTGSTEAPDVLTSGGDGVVAWRDRVDLNEYEHGSTLLLPGDVLLGFSSRDDVVQPPACELSMTAATPEVAAVARQWLLDAGTPLLPLVITTVQVLKPPALHERWTARDWTLMLSSMSPGAGREPEHQIFVPTHDVGPWMGRETECASDHPELVQLIASLCERQGLGAPPGASGDFRFASRADFDRVREALFEHLLKR